VDYSCYISKSKVDQLLASLNVREIQEISEESKTTFEKKEEAQ